MGRTGAAPEIYSLGLRNPFRWSFDRATGDLTIGDVGQRAIEEIDLVPVGGANGRNFGWACPEGSLPGPNACTVDAIQPVFEYDHSGAVASPSPRGS